jgi:hypothetical protein
MLQLTFVPMNRSASRQGHSSGTWIIVGLPRRAVQLAALRGASTRPESVFGNKRGPASEIVRNRLRSRHSGAPRHSKVN